MQALTDEASWRKVETAFKAPFPATEVSVRVGQRNKEKTKAQALPYIDARSVMERLDEVVGPGNWSDSYIVVNENAVVCTLTVHGISKSDAGQSREDKEDDFGPVKDLKAAFSDAFKRAAVKFGIGQFLYSLPRQWEELKNERYFVRKEQDILRDLLKGTNIPAAPKTAAPPAQPPKETASAVKLTQEQIDGVKAIKLRVKATDNTQLDPFIEECFEGKIKSFKELNGTNVNRFIEFMATKVPASA